MKKGTFKKPPFKEVIAKEKARRERLRQVLKEKREAKRRRKLEKKEKRRRAKEQKQLPNILKEKAHDFVKRRDSIQGETRKGYCITCGELAEGGNFQAGHFEPSSTCGALLRYHPHNIHGQCGFKCNINKHGQQKMGVEYTMKMIEKYGADYVRRLRSMKNVSIEAKHWFYETLIKLYNEGDEAKIVKYLDEEYEKALQAKQQMLDSKLALSELSPIGNLDNPTEG